MKWDKNDGKATQNEQKEHLNHRCFSLERWMRSLQILRYHSKVIKKSAETLCSLLTQRKALICGRSFLYLEITVKIIQRLRIRSS